MGLTYWQEFQSRGESGGLQEGGNGLYLQSHDKQQVIRQGHHAPESIFLKTDCPSPLMDPD